MRASILFGFGLVIFGLIFLYQTKNGFLMASLAEMSFAPPEDPEALAAEFEALSQRRSFTDGVSLGAVAAARLACATQLSGQRPGPAAAAAYRRMNLMLLGAGIDDRGPVIDPEAHRMAEIQRGLTNDTRAWREGPLSERDAERMDEILGALTRTDHPSYADLGLGAGFAGHEFSALVDASVSAGPGFQACVAQARR